VVAVVVALVGMVIAAVSALHSGNVGLLLMCVPCLGVLALGVAAHLEWDRQAPWQR
jgi:hypothetical protein